VSHSRLNDENYINNIDILQTEYLQNIFEQMLSVGEYSVYCVSINNSHSQQVRIYLSGVATTKLASRMRLLNQFRAALEPNLD